MTLTLILNPFYTTQSKLSCSFSLMSNVFFLILYLESGYFQPLIKYILSVQEKWLSNYKCLHLSQRNQVCSSTHTRQLTITSMSRPDDLIVSYRHPGTYIQKGTELTCMLACTDIHTCTQFLKSFYKTLNLPKDIVCKLEYEQFFF